MMAQISQTYRRFLVHWVDGARRFAVAVVSIALLATGALGYYTGANLGINTDTASLLDEDLPFRVAYKRFKEAFPQLSNLLVIVIDGEGTDVAEDAAEALAAELAKRKGAFRSVFYPAGEAFFVENGLLYLDLKELDDLSLRLADAQPLLGTLTGDMSLRGLFEVLDLAMDEVNAGDADPSRLGIVFDRIAEVAEAWAEGRPSLLSWRELMTGRPPKPEERRQFVLVQPVFDYAAMQPAGVAIDTVRTAAKALGLDADGGVRVRLTGSAAISHEELESVRDGAGRAGIISLILVSAVIVLGLRSLRLVVATLITLVMGLVWTAAFATFIIGSLNLMSVAFAVLFIGLSVDFGIHFALRYREDVARGLGHDEALRAAAAGVGGPLSLCALAAAAGFYAFVPTDYVGLSELGIIAGSGMFIALFANLTLLPALLSLMPLRGVARAPGFGFALAAENMLRRHHRKVALGALALGLVALVVAQDARFDFDPMHLRDPATESVATALELIRENDDPPYIIDVIRPSLEEAQALAARLEALAQVDDTVTLHDLVPGEQEEKLRVIEGMAMFLYPVLMLPGAAESPDDTARRGALTAFRDGLATFAASEDGGTMVRRTRRLDAALARLTAADALSEFEHQLLATLPKRLERLAGALSARPVGLEDLPDALARRYVAADGRARVEVYPAEDISDNDALKRFVAAVRAVAPDATGSPVLLLESGRAVVGAMFQASATALTLIAVLLLIILRSVRHTLLVLAPLLLAGFLTLATSAVLGPPFNFANVIVLPLLLGLGVASAIHLVMRAHEGEANTPLLGTSTPRAVVFSALTTIGSFGSLMVSSHRGTASMGELLTIAIFFTLVSALAVLPALMAWLAPRPRSGRG
jgi:hypothetical protein